MSGIMDRVCEQRLLSDESFGQEESWVKNLNDKSRITLT